MAGIDPTKIFRKKEVGRGGRGGSVSARGDASAPKMTFETFVSGLGAYSKGEAVKLLKAVCATYNLSCNTPWEAGAIAAAYQPIQKTSNPKITSGEKSEVTVKAGKKSAKTNAMPKERSALYKDICDQVNIIQAELGGLDTGNPTRPERIKMLATMEAMKHASKTIPNEMAPGYAKGNLVVISTMALALNKEDKVPTKAQIDKIFVEMIGLDAEALDHLRKKNVKRDSALKTPLM